MNLYDEKLANGFETKVWTEFVLGTVPNWWLTGEMHMYL